MLLPTQSLLKVRLQLHTSISKNSKQNIIAKTSMNTKTDKIEKLSKTLLFPSSAHQQIFHLHMTPAFIKIKIAANPR